MFGHVVLDVKLVPSHREHVQGLASQVQATLNCLLKEEDRVEKVTKEQILMALDLREEGLPLTATQKLWLLEHDKIEAQPPHGRPLVRMTPEDDELRARLSCIEAHSPGGVVELLGEKPMTPEQMKREILRAYRPK